MSGEQVEILLVDDDPQDRRLVQLILAKSYSPGQYNVQTSGTMSEAMRCLDNDNYDVVLLDLNLPDSRGIETVQKVRDANSDVIIIVLTGLDDEETGVEAIKKGASDYLVKGKYLASILVRTIRYALERKHTEREIQRSSETNAVLNRLLSLSLENLTLKEMLERAIDQVTSVAWLALESKGAIFLVEDEPDVLIMKAQRGLSASVRSTCARVRFDTCICGQAASSATLRFVDHVDTHHQSKYDEMPPHGHYRVPILSGGKLLGVINTYVTEGHQRTDKEEGFLRAVAAVLAGIIERRKVEDELRKHRERLELEVNERTADLQKVNKQLRNEIEERKQIEQELLIAKAAAEAANEAKSEFLANMSHELRTPLHCILSFASFGVKKYDKAKPEKLLDYFTRIRQSGKILLKLLNNLLDLAKLESGGITFTFERTSLSVLVRSVVHELEAMLSERDLSLRYDPSAFNEDFVLDADKIKQVLRNLLNNAIKFSPQGGIINIEVRPVGDSVRISVGDRGPGVPENELEAVFDKFVQSSKTKTGAGGTGLGLAICREIVAGHAGCIWAENRPEGGAVFTLEIPRLANTHVENRPSPADEASPTLHNESQPDHGITPMCGART
jgi:signal transduction histidine kinase/DNA-binding response OmpR family regulator